MNYKDIAAKISLLIILKRYYPPKGSFFLFLCVPSGKRWVLEW